MKLVFIMFTYFLSFNVIHAFTGNYKGNGQIETNEFTYKDCTFSDLRLNVTKDFFEYSNAIINCENPAYVFFWSDSHFSRINSSLFDKFGNEIGEITNKYIKIYIPILDPNTGDFFESEAIIEKLSKNQVRLTYNGSTSNDIFKVNANLLIK